MVTLVTLVTIVPALRRVSDLAPLILCPMVMIPKVGSNGHFNTLIPPRSTFLLFSLETRGRGHRSQTLHANYKIARGWGGGSCPLLLVFISLKVWSPLIELRYMMLMLESKELRNNNFHLQGRFGGAQQGPDSCSKCVYPQSFLYCGYLDNVP